MSTHFWVGMAIFPTALFAFYLMTLLVGGLNWLLTKSALFGTLTFGVERHEPVTQMLEQAPQDFRTAIYAHGRLGIILLAERKQPKLKEGDSVDPYTLPFMKNKEQD